MLRSGKLIDERWFKVQVGDVVLIENDNFVAVSLNDPKVATFHCAIVHRLTC